LLFFLFSSSFFPFVLSTSFSYLHICRWIRCLHTQAHTNTHTHTHTQTHTYTHTQHLPSSSCNQNCTNPTLSHLIFSFFSFFFCLHCYIYQHPPPAATIIHRTLSLRIYMYVCMYVCIYIYIYIYIFSITSCIDKYF
jgi:hypothetical protein